MPLVHCESCGAVIPSDRATCTRCFRPTHPRAARRKKWQTALPIAFGLAALGFWPLRVFARHRAAPSLGSEPVLLEQDTVSIASASSKGIPIELPYPGNVRLELTVIKGEAVNVHVISFNEWKALTKAEGKTTSSGFHFTYSEFEATGTHHATLSGHLSEGPYFIVIENPTLGELSMPVDVAVKAMLRT